MWHEAVTFRATCAQCTTAVCFCLYALCQFVQQRLVAAGPQHTLFAPSLFRLCSHCSCVLACIIRVCSAALLSIAASHRQRLVLPKPQRRQEAEGCCTRPLHHAVELSARGGV